MELHLVRFGNSPLLFFRLWDVCINFKSIFFDLGQSTQMTSPLLVSNTEVTKLFICKKGLFQVPLCGSGSISPHFSHLHRFCLTSAFVLIHPCDRIITRIKRVSLFWFHYGTIIVRIYDTLSKQPFF